MTQHFFDLHCHPIVKTLFKNRPNQISPWKNICIKDKILGNALESQCSLSMLLAQKNINLICMAVSPLEMGMMHQLILYVASRINPFKKYMDFTRLQGIADAKVDYQHELREELENLMIPEPGNLPGKKIKVLKSFKEYDENDFNTLHIIFTLEGAHTYYEHPENKNDDLKNMLQNFRNFLQLNNLVLFAGLTHLTPNVFCTHAYGNKILSKGRLMPRGCGITDYGKALVKEIYNHNILIDIKHTSWVARQQFYQLRKDSGWVNKPLIASHVALTGFSSLQRRDYIRRESIKKGNNICKISYNKKKGWINGTYFNPNSINLYDDDVVEILKSKGMIGIILDIRVLGGGKNIIQPIDREYEFITMEEFEYWKSFNSFDNSLYSNTTYNDVINNDEIINVWDQEERDGEKEEVAEMYSFKEIELRPEEHLKYFINQLLHLRRIADANADELKNINVWNHVCIGSDFDGLISPIHCCINAEAFNDFCDAVRHALPTYSNQLKINLGMPAKDIINNIFFDNGYTFIRNYFSGKAVNH